MIRSSNDLQGTKISARDGEIGKLYDIYFDNVFWKARYIVVDTGGWLTHNRVLLSPNVVGEPYDNFKNEIPVALTKKQVEKSPPYELEKPISMQYERSLHDYYRWRGYWLMDSPYGIAGSAFLPIHERERMLKKLSEQEDINEHLRSMREVTRYFIRAKNGDIGHVEDFLVDDQDWRIHYMVVDTRNWLPGGKKVIVSPHWIEDVLWEKSIVKVELTKEVIENSPEFDYETIEKADSMI